MWIGTNTTAGVIVGDTASCAISFNLPSAVSGASFNLFYALDNELGDSNAGIYINGIALPTSTRIGSFDKEYTYSDANITSLLTVGTNWLYLDGVNLSGPGAIIFSSDITYTSSGSTPEPATLILVGCGLLAASACRRRSHP